MEYSDELNAEIDLEQVLAECLFWRKRYNDSNPDVGMEPPLSYLLEDIINKTGANISDEMKERVLFLVEERTKK